MSYAEITSTLEELRVLVERCQDRDLAEYEAAHRALEGCLDQRFIGAEECDERLAHPMAMLDYIERLGTKYYEQGFASPAELAEKGARWQRLADRLTELRARAAGLTADSWQGGAAESYRARVPVFAAEVDRLIDLASAAQAGTREAAIAITEENDILRDIICQKDLKRKISEVAWIEIEKNWPSSDWWSMGRNAEQYSFVFFRRCAAASAALREAALMVAARIDDFDPDSNAALGFESLVAEFGGEMADGLVLDFCLIPPEQAPPGDGDQMTKDGKRES